MVEKKDDWFNNYENIRDLDYRKYNLQNVDGITLDSHSLQKFDLVILATDHDIFNYDLIKEHSKIIIDTRGRFQSIPNKIIKA